MPKLELPQSGDTAEFFVIRELASHLYKLTYVSHNQTSNRLLYIREVLPLHQIVLKCKDYCIRNNYRFIYVEEAIQQLDSIEEVIVKETRQ